MTADEMLAADPAFQTVCDERRDAWLAAMDAAHALPWELAWCGRDDEMMEVSDA